MARPAGHPVECLPISPPGTQECTTAVQGDRGAATADQTSLLGSMEQALRGQAGPALYTDAAHICGVYPHATGGWHRLRWVARPAERVLIWERGGWGVGCVLPRSISEVP